MLPNRRFVTQEAPGESWLFNVSQMFVSVVLIQHFPRILERFYSPSMFRGSCVAEETRENEEQFGKYRKIMTAKREIG